MPFSALARNDRVFEQGRGIRKHFPQIEYPIPEERISGDGI